MRALSALHRRPDMTMGFLKPITAGSWLLASCTAAAAAGLADIGTLIGDAACRTSQDCHVIGIGARACGGPEAYRAWSSWRTPAGPLQTLVSENAAARRRQLDSQGMASVCSMLPMPGVACSPPASASAPAGTSGTCTLQPGASGL
jgi:hypothetical protein